VIVAALGGACLAIAALGLVYLALALVFIARLGARPRAIHAGREPSVTILKPLYGAEPGLFDNLASFCRQDYGADVQIICGVQSETDPAIALVREVQAAFPGRAIDLVVDPTPHGANRKVANLINMAGGIRHDLVVLADSDMRVPPDYLARIATALSLPGIGGVTCLYHGLDTGRLWSRLSALAIDSHFLASVAVGMGLGLARPCFGSTIALRRETLDAIGGFDRFADELADDYALGAAIRGLGLGVAVPAFTIGHVCSERSAGDLAAQELRWIRTIRQIDPAGHAGSAVAHPAAFALAAAILIPGALSLTALAAALLLRIAVCLAVERSFGLRRHPYWLVPARDLLSFGLFLASFVGRDVRWRGHSYNVTPGGVLLPKAEP
jgi:ceramide glucosyltransferase